MTSRSLSIADCCIPVADVRLKMQRRESGRETSGMRAASVTRLEYEARLPLTKRAMPAMQWRRVFLTVIRELVLVRNYRHLRVRKICKSVEISNYTVSQKKQELDVYYNFRKIMSTDSVAIRFQRKPSVYSNKDSRLAWTMLLPYLVKFEIPGTVF